MAALPVYLLSLGALASPPPPASEPAWIEVRLPQSSLVEPAGAFSWENVASSALAPFVERGYAFAELSVVESELSGDTLVLYAAVDSGPPVVVTALGFSGEYRTNPRLLAHLAGFTGFLFSTAEVRRLAEALNAQGCTVLDWELLAEQPERHASASMRDLDLEGKSAVVLGLDVAEERVPNRLDALAGYSEQDGVVGSVDLAVKNPFGGRRSLRLGWRRLARYDLTFSLAAADPYPFRLPFGVEAGGAFRSLDESSYHLEAGAGVFVATPSFEVGLGYVYEHERSASSRVSKNLASTRLDAGVLRMSLRAGRRRVDGTGTSGYAAASGRLSLPVKLLWGFSLYLEPNGALVASRDSLLTTELVAVGGARTLRGYAEEEFRSELAAWSRHELRWGGDAFYIYPLFDAALIADAGFAAGYGGGVAVKTPIGRLELDAALPLDGAWRDAKLHLSLGADF